MKAALKLQISKPNAWAEMAPKCGQRRFLLEAQLMAQASSLPPALLITLTDGLSESLRAAGVGLSAAVKPVKLAAEISRSVLTLLFVAHKQR